MKFRLPVAFLLLPGGFCVMFAIIAGGVAVSQGPNADWTICRYLLGGLAACGAVYAAGRLSGRVEWIADEELVAMEKADQEKESEREIEALVEAAKDGTLEEKYRFKRYWHYGLIALVIALTFLDRLVGDAKMADGGKGMAVLGLTFGTWRLFGRSWTGFELLVVAGCVAALAYYLRKGLALLARANQR